MHGVTRRALFLSIRSFFFYFDNINKLFSPFGKHDMMFSVNECRIVNLLLRIGIKRSILRVSYFSQTSTNVPETSSYTCTSTKRDFLCHNLEKWPKHLEKDVLLNDCIMTRNFVTEKEEEQLMNDVALRFKRLRYEKSHWDDVRCWQYIYTEKSKWTDCTSIINRIRQHAFPATAHHLTVHVLDLHKEGYIKPHIDAVRYCGDTIAGLSLLSDSVMRLVHKEYDDVIIDMLLNTVKVTCRANEAIPRNYKHYVGIYHISAAAENNNAPRAIWKEHVGRPLGIRRLSCEFFEGRDDMYVMTGVIRYDFKHEVLKDSESYFGDIHTPRDRRVAVICRDLPKKKEQAAPSTIDWYEMNDNDNNRRNL